ncbi:MAG: hypothetical protein RBR02_09280 [Desulfuromonadaceae bacterium]|nr:hypothetical protein [Desulfuromonadaceae bacterium]
MKKIILGLILLINISEADIYIKLKDVDTKQIEKFYKCANINKKMIVDLDGINEENFLLRKKIEFLEKKVKALSEINRL